MRKTAGLLMSTVFLVVSIIVATNLTIATPVPDCTDYNMDPSCQPRQTECYVTPYCSMYCTSSNKVDRLQV